MGRKNQEPGTGNQEQISDHNPLCMLSLWGGELQHINGGSYASKENLDYAQAEGIVNVVFNKMVGSLKSQASSKNMETRLKRWRSGIEANISNLKRGFKIAR